MTCLKTHILLACAALFLISYYAESSPELEKAQERCFAKLSNPVSMAYNLHRTARFYQCFTSCLMKEMGTMSEDGVYNAECVISKIPTDHVNYDFITSTLRTCSQSPREADACEASDKISMCVTKAIFKVMPLSNSGLHQYIYGEVSKNEELKAPS